MADRVRKVKYCYVKVSNRAGHGVRLLGALAEAGVSLTGMVGFPIPGGKAQLDFIGTNLGAVRRVASRLGYRVSPVKKAFLIQGADKAGAVYRRLKRVADAGISITASAGAAAGGGRYGAILWVKPKDYARAARALGAK